ncbi:MAG: ABC transporter ATP-binding protein [Christensenellales bacterium]
MLRMEHIDKRFQAGTVNESVLFTDFNLTVEEGQFVSVIGSNGSGKTTMLNLLCGSMAADRGQILLDGMNVTSWPEHRRAGLLGRVFQDPSKGTCPELTLWENLSLADQKGKGFGLQRGINRRRRDEYRSMLEGLHIGLEDKLNIPMGNLSGGQRQAVALLMATMTPLRLLVLDEHTAALDPSASEIVMELTRRLVEEKKITTLMVTHNLRYAVNYGNRLLMMHEGSAVIDAADEEKEKLDVNAILATFNAISIECGN